MMNEISTVGKTLPLEESYSSGIGYIAVPSDIDRDKYLLDCYQNFRVSIHTAHSGFMNRVLISEDDLNFIDFPTNYKELGSAVYWIIDPINNQPYIIKRFHSTKKLGDNKENQFKIGRSFGDSFVEISGNAQKGFLSIAVNSDTNSEMNIVINNKNDKGKLNLNVKGDMNISSTGDNLFSQNGKFYSKTFDPNNEDTNTEIIQKNNEIDLNTPKLSVNNGNEPFTLGNKLKSFMNDLISEIASATVITMFGTSPLLNAIQIESYQTRVDEFLSEKCFLDK